MAADPSPYTLPAVSFGQLRNLGLPGLVLGAAADPDLALDQAEMLKSLAAAAGRLRAKAYLDNFLHGQAIDPAEVAARLREASAAFALVAEAFDAAAGLVDANPGRMTELFNYTGIQPLRVWD